VPVLFVILLSLHFWRVRKAKGVVLPDDADKGPAEAEPKRVLFIPNLLMREVTVGLVLIAFVLCFALIFNAPLGEPANPGMSPNPAKAPWYFLGLQELLLHFHPFFAVVVIPILAVVGLLALPYIRYDRELSGKWFLTGLGRRMAGQAAVTALVITPLLVILDEFVIDSASWFPGVPSVARDGVLPVVVILAVIYSYYRFMKRRCDASNDEAIQAIFVLLAVSLAVLTATGIWFRGTGMSLTWP
jgi:quinol-cytochrome oxidoreductase complex cytochrome b subunit